MPALSLDIVKVSHVCCVVSPQKATAFSKLFTWRIMWMLFLEKKKTVFEQKFLYHLTACMTVGFWGNCQTVWLSNATLKKKLPVFLFNWMARSVNIWFGGSPIMWPSDANPILEKRITVLLLLLLLSCHVQALPPHDSETGWTGELWSKTYLLKWLN